MMSDQCRLGSLSRLSSEALFVSEEPEQEFGDLVGPLLGDVMAAPREDFLLHLGGAVTQVLADRCAEASLAAER